MFITKWRTQGPFVFIFLFGFTLYSDQRLSTWLTTNYVRGLNSPFKCTKGLKLLKRKSTDVALLSETHLKPVVRRMQNRHYKKVVSFQGTAQGPRGL